MSRLTGSWPGERRARGRAVAGRGRRADAKVTAMPATSRHAGPELSPSTTDIVLANFGYVEEEFMFEGTANTYAPPGPDGKVES